MSIIQLKQSSYRHGKRIVPLFMQQKCQYSINNHIVSRRNCNYSKIFVNLSEFFRDFNNSEKSSNINAFSILDDYQYLIIQEKLAKGNQGLLQIYWKVKNCSMMDESVVLLPDSSISVLFHWLPSGSFPNTIMRRRRNCWCLGITERILMRRRS